MSYELYKEQADALSECVHFIMNNHVIKEPVLIFGAKGGTGKSFTANILGKVLSSFGLSGVAIAFTGRAVSHLVKSGIPARTFHSLMYKPEFDKDGDLVGFQRRTQSEILAEAGSYVLLDESSMIPSSMWDDVKSIGLPIVALGDYAQLPPIDTVNRDFNVMFEDHPRVSLETNRRTDPSFDGILKLCDHFRESPNVPRFVKGNGIKVVSKGETQNVNFIRDGGFDVIVCGMNKTRKKFNDLTRASRDFHGDLPNVGERIVCLKNTWLDNGSTYICNGELFDVLAIFEGVKESRFVVKSIDTGNQTTVRVLNEFWITEKMPRMKSDEAMKYQEFTFGYSLTCHKVQGSSFDNVLFYDEDVSFFVDQQKFRYTGTSRAAKHLTYAR